MIKLKNLIKESGIINKKVYHGTDKSFSTFIDKYKGSATGRTPSNLSGFFFTDNIDVAKTFGKRVITAFITINNPLIIDAKGKNYSEMKHILNTKIESAFKSKKYDGVIIKNYEDVGIYSDNGIISTQFIPFNVNQIKMG